MQWELYVYRLMPIYSVRQYFEKLKKKNGYISETRTNSKSKLTFPERQRVTAYFEEKFVYPLTENNISLYLRLKTTLSWYVQNQKKSYLNF